MDKCVGNCVFCCEAIFDNAPRIERFGHLVCSNCYLQMIEDIYSMAGHGDGGIIHFAFLSCLQSKHNRRSRQSLKGNKALWAKLEKKYRCRCVDCGAQENLSVDHIRPVSKGGSDSFSNLQILCRSCNSKKGAKWRDG